MARNYAQVRVSIWQDDDFRALPVEAQHLYFLLLTSPTLTLAGVTDWRPGRLASLAAGWTAEDVREAAQMLQERRYILADEDTEEVLVRTLVKHDGVLRNPKTAIGMVGAWTATYSQGIRAAVACEVRKMADEVSESVGRAIEPLLDYQSDWVWDDQSGRSSVQASVRVPVPPTTNNQQPTTNNHAKIRRADALGDFDSFWSTYPRRTAKGAAEKAWSKVTADHAVVIEAAELFASRCQNTDPKFIPHPATWLNQRRWEDDLAPAAGEFVFRADYPEDTW